MLQQIINSLPYIILPLSFLFFLFFLPLIDWHFHNKKKHTLTFTHISLYHYLKNKKKFAQSKDVKYFHGWDVKPQLNYLNKSERGEDASANKSGNLSQD